MNRRVLGVPIFVLIPAIIVLVLILANLGSIFDAGQSVLNFIFIPDERIKTEVIACSDSSTCSIVHPIVFSAILLIVLLTGFAYTTLLERKLLAWLQQRVGPNRVGPNGLLQPVADGIKLIFKEDIVPDQAKYIVWYLAPMLKVVPTLVVLAVVPLGSTFKIPWFAPSLGDVWYEVPLVLADLNVGVLWILAITSLGTYGVVGAGWSSNNKYSMLGGLRASAQMVSYELSMGITLAVPVMIAGSMSVVDVVEGQSGLFLNWYIFQNPLAGAILMIALLAEVNRAPFDLPEAEQELTAGYITEYSGMKFATFMMAEYLGMIAMSTVAASMFFGGYHDGFGLVDKVPLLAPMVIIGKVILLLAGMIWVRATLPRVRYDRLMMLGWKILLPLAILSVAWTAVAVVIGEEFGLQSYAVISTVMFIMVFIGAILLFMSEDGATVGAGDEDAETDPMITGEQSGASYAILQLLGGLLAIPFVLYDGTIGLLDNLAKLGDNASSSDDD